jgi:hypothetical protein
MLRHLGTRLGAALVIGAIWLGSLVAPAAAAGTVRYVDDNLNNACHGTHFHSIQAAINASANKDVVYVCPGTYAEELVIDVPGLTVQSLQYRKAKLVPPTGEDGLGAMVVIAANGVKFRGFKIEIPAGEVAPAVPVQGGLPPDCIGFEVAIVVLGQRDGVWGNHISTVGDATLSGECGYAIGILFAGEDLAGFTPLGSTKSSAKRNYIRDFKLAGILAEGAVSVRIARNQIRYVHQNDPFTCVPINTIAANPSLTFPCEEPLFLDLSPLNGVFVDSVGIGVFGAHADVNNNTVFSTFDIALLEGGGAALPLGGGIIFQQAAPGSRITENVVTQVFVGIGVDPDLGIGTPIRPTGVEPSTGIDITFNRAVEGFAGFLIDSDNNYVYANRARLNVIFGIATFVGEGNLFLQNDARYNAFFGGGYDCDDETTGTGTANTANTWTDNIGNSDNPDGICLDIGPF